MGSINLKHTGSGSAIALSSDGTSLLLNGTAIGGGGGADLYDANESSPSAQPSATGTNAIAIGDSAISTNTNSFALGKSRSVGISSFAALVDNNTTTYGAKNNNGIAIGKFSAAGTASVCIGYGGWAGGSHSYSIGESSSNQNYYRTYSFGHSIFASADNQVNIAGAGQDVRISETYTLPKVDGTASGQVLTTNGSGVVSWATPSGGGGGADLYDANESSPSAQPSATGTNAIAIGDSAVSAGTNSVALGKSRASGADSFAAALSVNSTTYQAAGTGSIAMGSYALTQAGNCVAIGSTSSTSIYSNSIAIGRQATSSGSFQITLGHTNTDVRISSAYTLPKVDGSANQVLTTNGSGAVSWATAGGGSSHAMELISSANVTSATNNIDFTGLNNTSFKTFRLIVKGAKNASTDNMYLQLLDTSGNVLTGSKIGNKTYRNYALQYTISNQDYFMFSNSVAGNVHTHDYLITVSPDNKCVSLMGQQVDSISAGTAPNYQATTSGTYTNTSAITLGGIRLDYYYANNFTEGKYSLYGIKE